MWLSGFLIELDKRNFIIDQQNRNPIGPKEKTPFLFYNTIVESPCLNFKQIKIFFDFFDYLMPFYIRNVFYQYTYYSKTVEIFVFVLKIYLNILNTNTKILERKRLNLQYLLNIQLE